LAVRGIQPVIDKVEVRLPARTQFSSEFAKLYRDIHHDPDRRVNPFRSSAYYTSVGDLRRFGYDAVLHLGCQSDKEGNHKLELIDTGKMTYGQMANEIERIFDANPRRLEMMRVDLAADVRDVPVSWFAGHVRARWKRFAADLGKIGEGPQIEYCRMGKQKVETLYFGKRPNCFRIYDKIAEFKHQYAQLTRRASDAAELPSFDDVYGYPESGVTLTRVERQIGGSRVPTEIDTFGKLKRAPEFNPFDKLEFLAAGESEPSIEKYGLNAFLFGKGLRQLIEAEGLHRARAFVNAHSGGHASRILATYREFLPSEAGIDGRRLFWVYQQSLAKQLAA
jgi:hypothetical protein